MFTLVYTHNKPFAHFAHFASECLLFSPSTHFTSPSSQFNTGGSSSHYFPGSAEIAKSAFEAADENNLGRFISAVPSWSLPGQTPNSIQTEELFILSTSAQW